MDGFSLAAIGVAAYVIGRSIAVLILLGIGALIFSPTHPKEQDNEQ